MRRSIFMLGASFGLALFLSWSSTESVAAPHGGGHGGGGHVGGGGAHMGGAGMSSPHISSGGGMRGGFGSLSGISGSAMRAGPSFNARSMPNIGSGANFARSNPSFSARPNASLGTRPSLNLGSPNLGSSLSRATNIAPRQFSGSNPLGNNLGALRGSTMLNPGRSNLSSSNLTPRSLNGINSLSPQGLSSSSALRSGLQNQTTLRPSLNNALAGANRNPLNNPLLSGNRSPLNSGLNNSLPGANRNPLNSNLNNPLAGLNRNGLNNSGLNSNRVNNASNTIRPLNAGGQGLAGANRNNLQNININNNNNLNLNNFNRGTNGNINGSRGLNNNLANFNGHHHGPNAYWNNGNWNNINGSAGRWNNGQWANGNWNGNWNGNNYYGHYHNYSWYHGHRYNPFGYYGGFGGWGLWGLGFGSGWGGYGGWGYGYPYGGYGYGYGGYGLTSLLYRSGYCSYYNPYYVASPTVIYDYAQPIPVVLADADPVPVPAAINNLEVARQSFKNANYGEALTAVNRAIQAQPDDAVLHELRALTLFAMSDYDQAAATLYSVLAVGPGWDWATMVGLYPNVETYTNQLRSLETFAKNNPQSASARFVLAYHYMTQGFPQEAAITLKEVLALKPNDQGAANLLKMLEQQLQGGNPNQNQALAALGNPAGMGANPNVVAKPPLAVPPLDVLPAGMPNNAPAVNAPAINGPALLGQWQAARDKDKFQLTLAADQSFTWKYAQGERVETLTGTYNVEGSLLVMQVKDGGQMIGRVTVVRDPAGNPAGFEFKMLGANPDDPGLRFGK